MKQQISLSDVDRLAWTKGDGLLPAIVQEAETGQVLMLAYMNRASLEQTLTSGLACFFSRSRQSLWVKGETSGHRLHVLGVATDCDLDTILLTVSTNGPVCHRLTKTCFDQQFCAWDELWHTIESRAGQSSTEKQSYTQQLLSAGIHKIAQKVGEEAVETALAAKDEDTPAFLGEVADLVYHLLVLLKAKGADPAAVGAVLAQRALPKTP